MVKNWKLGISETCILRSALLLASIFFIQVVLIRLSHPQVSQGGTTSEKYCFSENTSIVSSCDTHSFDAAHSPLQSQQKPVSFPIEEKEKEVEESIDDDNKLSLRNHSIFYYASILSWASFVHFEQTVLNRSTVSLVILHHSWRSFLS